jgi:ubiquitin carboxyl-terminal hydrolase 22/27/51
MAASPNSATRSHSSSAATPDGLFDEAVDNTGCTHISALLADSAESDPLLKRFRSVVTWKAQRTHEALHSAKRRKVRFIYLPPLYAYIFGQVALPMCGTCGLVTPRPFVCLDCAFSGCWQDDHIVEHLKDENHRFCASM